MDLPVGRVELVDVLLGEELRCRVRAFEGGHLPGGGEGRACSRRDGASLRRDRSAAQDVARAQRPAAVAAEAAQGEGGRAAQERRDVQAAAREEDVGAQSVFRGGADGQYCSGGHGHRLPVRDR